jgi:large-conductance mechanosensitive channel
MRNEEGGKGWGALIVAAIINWLFYAVVLFAIVFGIRKWRRKARATSSSM